MRAGAAAIRAAIIDLDGTMLDTVPDFEAALNGMRADLGLKPITQATIKPLVGKGSEKLVRDALLLDWDAARVDAAFDDALAGYQRHYLAINGDRATLFDGVLEGLAAMKAQGLRLACVTNKPVAFTTPLLVQKGLAPWFELVYGGDSFMKKKPDPMPLLAVCSAFDLAPISVVAIGDSSNDAEAARAAGCYVLTVPYGYNHGRPIQEINSDGIVSSLLEAAQLIAEHNRTST
ncbi:phosphoglycolate phosphatase [Massilia yuzhufengensis]|uniref:Phosphoglycolate phosphatase n=1 Tax=Massilia yuzhufengensis TaxID=1164594 RepID=A0A1I1VE30_9BURK|nr:phosphoglycolate phosphatase [Massilia yuzhufengensis]SFD81247.1 phosphoglycolate phosphatase [Massilia yuzhufengensis]